MIIRNIVLSIILFLLLLICSCDNKNIEIIETCNIGNIVKSDKEK
jgi:membrane protein involved in colicin uptake